MQITPGQMVARYLSDGRDARPIIGMVVAATPYLDAWTVEWYDSNNNFQIRYETNTVSGYANAYNRLRKNLCETQLDS